MNETTKERVTMIDIKNLSPHPDNLRKDLGDLSELADSIAENGIMQNLTVVPWVSSITDKPGDNGSTEGWYTVVIGHRRLAAAKQAGLTEVPCAITDMDKKKQIATMLLENMQRNDLTILEQAQGFQMMFDFGDTIADVSKMTGLSDSTVRRRANLLKLDQDKLGVGMQRGATLNDFIKLEEIKDDDLRNKVLEYVGTSNFDWELGNATSAEQWLLHQAEILCDVKEYALPFDENVTDVEWDEEINQWSHHKYKKPSDTEDKQYYYRVAEDEDGEITLWCDRDKDAAGTEVDEAETEKQRQLRKLENQLDDMYETAYGLRSSFVREKNPSKDEIHVMLSAVFKSLLRTYYSVSTQRHGLAAFLNFEDTDTDVEYENIEDDLKNRPYKYLLYMAYSAFSDAKYTKYSNWKREYEPNETLNGLYEMLIGLGYAMSEDEKMLQDGTHSIFKDLVEGK